MMFGRKPVGPSEATEVRVMRQQKSYVLIYDGRLAAFPLIVSNRNNARGVGRRLAEIWREGA